MTFKISLLTLALFCSTISVTKATNPSPYTITTDKNDQSEEAMNRIAMGMNDILNNYNDLTDDEYRQRIQSLSSEIDFKIDPLIKERIVLRVEKSKTSTELTLGRAEIYFPIFEEHLAKHDVPHLMKYLAIIESNLEPRARSHAGAGGLWQFMPATGKMYNMSITTTLDERSDTYKASEAAAKLLAHLKKYHGDWCLALASYNCGAGRVNKAIKAAGSTDYWVVRHYLPTETQKYVPYFMAMVYVGEFAAMHGLTPTTQHRDLVLTDTIHYTESTTLARLAEQVGVGVDTVRFLNPSYLKNYIPRSSEPNIIVLPARAVAQMRGYEAQFEFLGTLQTENPMRAVRRINSYEDLVWLAKAFRCTVKDLYIWNALPENYQVKQGDLIAIRKYNAVKDAQQFATSRRPTLKQNETIVLPALQIVALQNNKAVTVVASDLPKIAAQNPARANAITHTQSVAAVSKRTAAPEVVSAPVVAPVNTKPTAAVATATPTTQQGDVNVSRERGRNLRGETSIPTAAVAPVSANAVVVETKVEPKQEPKAEVKTVVDNTSSNIKATVIEPQIQKMDENVQQRSRPRNLRQENVPTIAVPTTEVAPVAVANPTATTATTTNADAEKPSFIMHTVKSNESLWDILEKYPNTTTKEVMEINRVMRATDIYTGQVLKIPAR
jgi:membrane-bound lytic murein transglycosylase D